MWEGTQLGIRIEGQAEYQYVDLRGPSGAGGKNLEFTWNGTKLGVRREGETTFQYVDLRGPQGLPGTDAAVTSANIIGALGYTPTGIEDIPTSLPANGGNADTVDNYHLNQDVRTTGSPSFANMQVPSFENLKINGNLNNKVIYPDVNQIAQAPIAPSLWHDHLAFCRVTTPTFETSVDGTAWANGTLDKRLFSHKENQAVTVLNPTSTKAVRWTWNSGQISWSSISWIILGITYVATAPNITVLIQSSADGTNWTTRHQSTYARSSMPVWHYMNSLGGDKYLRITITHNSGGEVKLSSIRALTTRWGDQGQGRELAFPYDWDENMNMTVLGQTLKIGSKTVATTDDIPTIPTVPTKTSQLDNDSGFLTSMPNTLAEDLHIKKLANDKVASLVTEVNGQLIDFGTNYTQSGQRRAGEHGGLFRIDVRDGSPLFNVIFQDASGSPETTPFSVTRDGTVNAIGGYQKNGVNVSYEGHTHPGGGGTVIITSPTEPVGLAIGDQWHKEY